MWTAYFHAFREVFYHFHDWTFIAWRIMMKNLNTFFPSFAPDGCKNHLLPLIMNRHVQEGGLLLVEDDVSIVAQKEGDSFGVALCCSKVKRSVPFFVSLICCTLQISVKNDLHGLSVPAQGSMMQSSPAIVVTEK